MSNYSDPLIDFCFLYVLHQALKININSFILSLSEALGGKAASFDYEVTWRLWCPLGVDFELDSGFG